MNAADHPPSCTCREHPLHASMRVRDGLEAYLAENGFTRHGYEAPRTTGSIFGIKISVPNPPAHRRALKLHDLVHVATGYGTDHQGEGEISAWQLGRGLGGAGAYVAVIVMTNVLLGIALSPRATIAALRTSGCGASLFLATVSYEALLESTVGELRTMLRLSLAGIAQGHRRLHAGAPDAAIASAC